MIDKQIQIGIKKMTIINITLPFLAFWFFLNVLWPTSRWRLPAKSPGDEGM